MQPNPEQFGFSLSTIFRWFHRSVCENLVSINILQLFYGVPSVLVAPDLLSENLSRISA